MSQISRAISLNLDMVGVEVLECPLAADTMPVAVGFCGRLCGLIGPPRGEDS